MTIIVEPYGCWHNRMIEQRLRAEAEGRKRNIGRLHPIQEDLMYLVREHQEPIRDTTLNYKGQDRGVGTAFAQDATQGNAFSKLTHYQTSLFKTLRLAEEKLGRLKSESAKVLLHSQPAQVLNTPARDRSHPNSAALGTMDACFCQWRPPHGGASAP